MKLQLHLKEDNDITIKIVGVDGYKEFYVCNYDTLVSNIDLEEYDLNKLKNPVKWNVTLLSKVIKQIFKKAKVPIRNENLKRLYRKSTGEELRFNL